MTTVSYKQTNNHDEPLPSPKEVEIQWWERCEWRKEIKTNNEIAEIYLECNIFLFFSSWLFVWQCCMSMKANNVSTTQKVKGYTLEQFSTKFACMTTSCKVYNRSAKYYICKCKCTIARHHFFFWEVTSFQMYILRGSSEEDIAVNHEYLRYLWFENGLSISRRCDLMFVDWICWIGWKKGSFLSVSQ